MTALIQPTLCRQKHLQNKIHDFQWLNNLCTNDHCFSADKGFAATNTPLFLNKADIPKNCLFYAQSDGPAILFIMTVHKSQGSEFDHSVLILPEEPCPVLDRELLYSPLTRAKKRFTLLGGEQQIRTMKYTVMRIELFPAAYRLE